MNILLEGSLAAAFATGMVAFFAPCCAGVMLPAYLAAIGGGRRLRTARLTALYVAGVATVVLPVTFGAAAFASIITRWHPQLFTFGGLMMLGVAAMLWRGLMLPVNIPQPRLTGSALSVYGLGAFSGAATACCAPVLAGAIALSATSATLLGGILTGSAYVAGMIVPLVPIALFYGKAKNRVSDPQIALRLGQHRKQIGIVRLSGVVIFSGFGVLFIVLAMTGLSNTAPAFQKSMGVWARQAGAIVAHVPNVVSLPILVLGVAMFAYAVLKKGRGQVELTQSKGHPSDCCREEISDVEVTPTISQLSGAESDDN